MTALKKAEHLVRNHPANKELMELRFGCEVELQINHISPYIAKGRVCGKNDWSDAGDFDHHREKSERLTIQAGWYRGDDYVITDFTPDKYKILGKPAHLEHYLRVLGDCYMIRFEGDLLKYVAPMGKNVSFFFNLTTGKPATEKDAEEFIKLVS